MWAPAECPATKTGPAPFCVTQCNARTPSSTALLAGWSFDCAGFNATNLPFWAAVINGLLAPPLIVIILFICNNPRVMGRHVNGRWLNLLGILAAAIMTLAAAATLFFWL